MYPSVHSSTIYNSQDVETAEYPSTDDWFKKMWYVYTVEYYSAVKENEIMPFAATRMDIENITLSEVSQVEKDKYISHHLYVEAKKYNTSQPILQNRTDSQK